MASKRSRSAKRSAKLTPEEVYLLKLIEISRKNISAQGLEIDKLFAQQADKLEAKLQKLRGN